MLVPSRAATSPIERGRETAAACEQPDGVEAILTERELAEQRAEREPAPEAEAVEAQRLAAAVLGREVGDHRRRSDEQQRLSDAREQAQCDQGLRASRRRCTTRH